MQSTLNPKQTDPHDMLVIAPDVVLVAPADREFSHPAHDTISRPWDPQTHAGSDFSAGPPVPPVDTTFRATSIHDVRVPGYRPSVGGRALRTITALLLATCIGGAAIAWQSSGNVARQMIAKWAPKFIVTSLLPLEQPGLAAQPAPPAVQPAAAPAAPPQPEAAPTAPEGAAPAAAAPPPEPAQSLESMARDLASGRREIEQLKASIEQLKASQQQMSRDIARVSEAKSSEAKSSEAKVSETRASGPRAFEQNPRPRISAPRPAVHARRPAPPLPPPPVAATPYVPRLPEPPPQATAQPLADPELSPVPRPPMPVR